MERIIMRRRSKFYSATKPDYFVYLEYSMGQLIQVLYR